ncbi:antibiotic biosynthesis monooxygenase [Symbioplanes lichenis]|uniref:antibiotic biosynthesis monooxygenase n=1 Tax=Symbioplanes lichenis TaxID=1629072 RepID=UPI0027392D25|nr:antibiotic biosynthesis monooxygenase [Actinoplanes lichenis]
MQKRDRYPALGRAAFAVTGEWHGPEKEAVAAELLAARRREPWPEGLLTWSVFVDADGEKVRDYAQWSVEPTLPDLTIAGAESHDRAVYRLHRGTTPGPVEPGAVVFIRADTTDAGRARTWIDAVFAALAGGTDLPPGGLGAFFHISTDGSRVLNYAEWESPEAHRRALAATQGESVSLGPLWDRVHTMPGVRPVSVTRYLLHASLGT